MEPSTQGITFADVADVDETKAELTEIADFLRHPEKYAALGGHVPHGVLLAGPPGTGKTLLAWALAGEAAVPFFSVAASEFVELYVGVGKRRWTLTRRSSPLASHPGPPSLPSPTGRLPPMTPHDDRRVLVGFDGSLGAAGAIELAARLLPGRRAWIAHLWAPSFAATEVRARLSQRAGTVHEMVELLEREAQADAERIAADGVTLAAAAGWPSEPYLKRAYGAEGLELAALAEEMGPEVLVVGARGVTGVRAVLGSVSDEAVHASPVPVLVVPRAVLTPDRDAAAGGPVIVGDDGSPGAARAAAAARELFPEREQVPVHAQDAGSGRAVAEALVHRARSEGAGLIVVGSRGRSAGREIMLGSAAMALLHHADRPVLVVPAARSAATA